MPRHLHHRKLPQPPRYQLRHLHPIRPQPSANTAAFPNQGGFFVFQGSDGNDVITDFNVAQDFINVLAWNAGSSLSVSYAYDAVSGLYDATVTDGVNGSISVEDIANNSLVNGVNLFA